MTQDYDFEERNATDMPFARHYAPQEALDRLFAAAANASQGRAIFVKAGPVRLDVQQLRDRLAKAARRRKEPYVAISDFDQGGVWLRRNAADNISAPATTAAAEHGATQQDEVLPTPPPRLLPAATPPEEEDASASIKAAQDLNQAAPVCTCSLHWKVNTRYFNEFVRNEGHDETCPMYRQGAHRWDLPSTSDGNGGYAGRCIWCGQTKEHRPFDEPTETGDHPATTRRPGVCPICNRGYKHPAHRAHKQAASA